MEPGSGVGSPRVVHRNLLLACNDPSFERKSTTTKEPRSKSQTNMFQVVLSNVWWPSENIKHDQTTPDKLAKQCLMLNRLN